MIKFRNKYKYNMNKTAASETLQNVFAACEQEPNETPLEVIRVYTIANAAIVKFGFWTSIVFLIVVLMMPFAFTKSEKTTVREDNVKVVEHYLDETNNRFYMTVDGSDINFDGIYARGENGALVLPVEVNEQSGEVVFPFERGNLNIYIPTRDGNVTQAVLSR